MAAAGGQAAPSSSNNSQIKIKVKTLGQASYDLEVAQDVSFLLLVHAMRAIQSLHELQGCDQVCLQHPKSLYAASKAQQKVLECLLS